MTRSATSAIGAYCVSLDASIDAQSIAPQITMDFQQAPDTPAAWAQPDGVGICPGNSFQILSGGLSQGAGQTIVGPLADEAFFVLVP